MKLSIIKLIIMSLIVTLNKSDTWLKGAEQPAIPNKTLSVGRPSVAKLCVIMLLVAAPDNNPLRDSNYFREVLLKITDL
jgi:hypothetical protein